MEESLGLGKKSSGPETDTETWSWFRLPIPKPSLGRTLIYTRINISWKYEGNCGLWVPNEILKKMYPENLKKIVGAVWELPAK